MSGRGQQLIRSMHVWILSRGVQVLPISSTLYSNRSEAEKPELAQSVGLSRVLLNRGGMAIECLVNLIQIHKTDNL